MNLGPSEVIIILLILGIVVVPIAVGAVFLARNRGLDDSGQAEAYPPGWEPPPASPPPPPHAGPAAPPSDAGPPPGPPPG